MVQTVDQVVQPDLTILREYASSRDPSLFSELAARYTSSVYATCYRITSNAHDAEEITQDCFFELAKQAQSIKSSVAGWLHRLATNRSLNMLRSRKRRKAHEQNAYSTHDDHDTRDSNWSDVSPVLDEAIDALPDEFREAIVQHYLEGISQSEIAKRLNLNQSTVSRRVSQGLKSLRKQLTSRGLTLGLTAMASMLMENTAEAASNQLVSSVTKIGIAGVGPKLVNFATLKLTTWLKAAASCAMPILIHFLVGGWLSFATGAVMILYLSWFKPSWFIELIEAFGSSSKHFRNFNLLDRWSWTTPPKDATRVMRVSFIVAALLFSFAAVYLLGSDFPNRFGMSALFALIAAWRFAIGIRLWWRLRRFMGDVTPKNAITQSDQVTIGDVAQAVLSSAGITLLLSWSLMMRHATGIGFYGWFAVVLGLALLLGVAEIVGTLIRYQPSTRDGMRELEPTTELAARRATKLLIGFAVFMVAAAWLQVILTWNQPGNASDVVPFVGVTAAIAFQVLAAAVKPLLRLWQANRASRTLVINAMLCATACLIANAYWLAIFGRMMLQ